MKANKIILSMAVAAALPFAANATNISGDMYTAPTSETNLTPAPTTEAEPPYGRINIDTDDQNHIATTAYVKGAYNSAIAGVNYMADNKQDRLYNHLTDEPMGTNVVGADDEAITVFHQWEGDGDYNDIMENLLPELGQEFGIDYSASLITAEAALKLYAMSAAYKQQKLSTTVNNQSQDMSSTIAQTVNTTTPSATTLVSEAAIAGAINGVTTNLSTNYATNSALNSKRVTVYTTWGVDDGTAVTQVPFSTAQ